MLRGACWGLPSGQAPTDADRLIACVEPGDTGRPAVTAGDPRLIESLVANLIDNAIRHNHPDGHVEITTQPSGTQRTLTVTNSGPVIPDNQIHRLFHPFQKRAPDRDGHRDGYGLGLAIVNAVTQAHHATLTISA